MTFKNYPSGLWRLNVVLYPLHLDPSFPPFILSNLIVPAFIQYFGTSNTCSVFLAISFVFFFAFYQDTSFLSPPPSIHLHLPSFSLCNCTHLLLFIGPGPDSPVHTLLLFINAWLFPQSLPFSLVVDAICRYITVNHVALPRPHYTISTISICYTPTVVTRTCCCT